MLNRKRASRAPLGAVLSPGPLSAAMQRAAFGLRQSRPQASAALGSGAHAALWAGPAAFALGLGLVAPDIILALGATLAALAFLTLAALRLASAILPVRWSPRAALGEDALPSATVIVALYDEAASVDGLVAKLGRLDYPASRLEIVLAVEAHDQATVQAATQAAADHPRPVRVVALPKLGPQTKPRALNAALALSDGEIVAVYDAEDAPHPGQLRAAAEALAADPGLACVQAPLNWYNHDDNVLTRLFALEYAAQFNALLPLFLRLGWPLPLGGTSNVFRGLMYQLHQA